MAEQPLPNDAFDSLEVQSGAQEKLSRVSVSYWRDVWRRFRKNRLALFGVILLVILGFFAAFGPSISGFDYHTNDLLASNKAPSGEHWFGTDQLGRDMFSRVWYGARVSLFIGLAAAFIDLAIGVIWGAAAAFFGGKVDEVLMRIADILFGIPYLLVVILLLVVMPKGLFTIILAMSITGWINMARIVRGEVLKLKSEEYAMAAKALGAGKMRILFRHLISNTMGPILVTLTLTIPNAIFTEAFLSFIGLGVPAPKASWGTMTNDGLSALEYYPWELFFPAIFICLAMLAFNVIGDGMRDALDPKERK